jgi:hypothetical protein
MDKEPALIMYAIAAMVLILAVITIRAHAMGYLQLSVD